VKEISRQQAELLLVKNNTFLVREVASGDQVLDMNLSGGSSRFLRSSLLVGTTATSSSRSITSLGRAIRLEGSLNYFLHLKFA
jgi:hypothetical protein